LDAGLVPSVRILWYFGQGDFEAQVDAKNKTKPKQRTLIGQSVGFEGKMACTMQSFAYVNDASCIHCTMYHGPWYDRSGTMYDCSGTISEQS
jgi:hypothetical protein